MSPHQGRSPAVASRRKPTGPVIDYPVCTDWTCDDEYDWESIGPDDENYAAVRREHDIVHYHQPREGWLDRLQAERAKRSGGDPLWWGRP